MDKTVVAAIIGAAVFISVVVIALTTHSMNAMETQKTMLSRCLDAKGIWLASPTSSYGGHCIIKE